MLIGYQFLFKISFYFNFATLGLEERPVGKAREGIIISLNNPATHPATHRIPCPSGIFGISLISIFSLANLNPERKVGKEAKREKRKKRKKGK